MYVLYVYKYTYTFYLPLISVEKTEWKEPIKFKSEVGENCIKESVWLVCTLNVNDQNFLSSEPVPKTLDNFRFAVRLHSLSATVSVLTSFLSFSFFLLGNSICIKIHSSRWSCNSNEFFYRANRSRSLSISLSNHLSWYFLLLQGKNCCIQLRVNFQLSITVSYMLMQYARHAHQCIFFLLSQSFHQRHYDRFYIVNKEW